MQNNLTADPAQVSSNWDDQGVASNANSTSVGEGRIITDTSDILTEEELPFAFGAIDHYDTTHVGGWIASELKNERMFVEVNGHRQFVTPILSARADLIAGGIDGYGFVAYFINRQVTVELRLGTISAENPNRPKMLRFSQSGASTANISELYPSHAVISAEDIAIIAASIDPDTIQYLSFTQKYGRYLAPSSFKFDVIFIDGTSWSISTRYRVLNIAEGLKELGYTTIHARIDEIDLGQLAGISARVAVFFRAPYHGAYKFLADAYRTAGTRIVFDVDDLVFDEAIVSRADGVRFLSHEQMSDYLRGVEQYRAFAAMADLVTAPTKFLADYARENLSKDAAVIINSIGKNYLSHYEIAKANYTRGGESFVIGYYSGSKTHQVDFQQACPAIVRLMRTYADVRLRVVGLLDFDEFPDLAPLSDRIISVPFMTYWEMLNDLAACDVIIAPVIPGDPFCESKSELKFFEAALRGRPCIASPTQAFVTATSNGKYGYLANDSEEWFVALSELYLSTSSREALAVTASTYVRKAYSYAMAGAQAADAYFGLPKAPLSQIATQNLTISRRTDRLSVGVLVPDIIIGGGGHRKIFSFCKYLADSGMDVHIYVDSPTNPALLKEKIFSSFCEFQCEVTHLRGVIDGHDVVVCTHWKTAYALRGHPRPNKVIYFVQDFEPIFSAAGTEYVKALSTYRLGFNLVCYGKWVADRIHREFDLDATVVPFSFDKTLYRPLDDLRKSVDVLFFARRGQSRRCFELGIESLKLAYSQNNSLRIALFGEESYGDLGFPYANFGMVLDLQQLRRAYSVSRLGICFSTTNPSLVGYEMIATGLPLLDIRVPGSHLNFGGEDFVYYADASPESVCCQIGKALSINDEWKQRRAAGLAYVANMPGDEIIGDCIRSAIERIIV